MSSKKLSALLILLCCTFFCAQAQIGHGGFPYVFSNELEIEVPTEVLPSVDQAEMLAIDEEYYMEKSRSIRFGQEHMVSIGLENAGVWTELDNGDRLWQLKLNCPDAYHINLIYDQFHLPAGGLFYVYSEDKQALLGAFTSGNNKSYGRFSTGIVKGSVTMLEYFEPATVRGQGVINIETVVHGYRSVLPDLTKGYGDSGSCNVNINCPEGDDWQTEKRSVLRIVSGGFDWCTGAMINNTRQDCSPYFLTANHCAGDTNNWVFYFNWEAPGCENVDIPLDQSISGGTPLAGSFDGDGMLLELSASPPEDYNTYWAGWSVEGVPVATTVGIHHPSGDIKKICINEHATTSGSFISTPNSHWIVDNWETGVTEGGSSGSPLFDTNKRIIGMLSGGAASCSNIFASDLYGKMSFNWDAGSTPSQRLEDWLDPDGTGVQVLDGKYCSTSADAALQVLVEPSDGICQESFLPQLIVQNIGSVALVSMTIEYQLDANPLMVFDWTGNIAPFGAIETITLPATSNTLGSHSLSACIKEVNGETQDADTSNDCLGIQFVCDVLTGVEDIDQAFSIYPNPAKDQINFNLPVADNSETEIFISNVAGKILYRASVVTNSHQWNIPGEFANGIYFVNFLQGKSQKQMKFAVLR